MVKACQRCGGMRWLSLPKEGCSPVLRPLVPHMTSEDQATCLPKCPEPHVTCNWLKENRCGDSRLSPFILIFKIKLYIYIYIFFNAVDFLEKMRPREQRWRHGGMTTQAAAPKQSRCTQSGDVLFSLWLYSIFHLYLKLSWWVWIQICRVTVESYLFICMDLILRFKRESA